MTSDEGETPDSGQVPSQENSESNTSNIAMPKKGGRFPRWALWTTIAVGVLVVIGIVVGVILALGGGEEVNQSPSITSLTADPESVDPGEASTVTCVANDSDGDKLNYAWEYSGGELQGVGNTVTWIAPSAANTYTVGVTVSDGEGGTDVDSVAISVGIVVPTPTPVLTATPSSTTTATPTGIVTATSTSTPTSTSTSAPSSTSSEGAIYIQSSPAGAEVYIDGADKWSTTPYSLTHAAPGDHVVLLTLYHYKNKMGIITVNAGETASINWALDYAPTQSVTIQPDGTAGKDAEVNSAWPSSNLGSSDSLYLLSDSSAQIHRAYIQFDLSLVPPAAVILNASLGLYYCESPDVTSGPVGLYVLTGAWDESTITWDDQPSFDVPSESTSVLPATATHDFVYWDIKSLVQGWVNHHTTNNGVMLKDPNESSFEGWKRFYSSDYNTNPTARPKLVIDYYDPTP